MRTLIFLAAAGLVVSAVIAPVHGAKDETPFQWPGVGADGPVPQSHLNRRIANGDIAITSSFAYLRDLEFPDAANDFMEFTGGGQAYEVRYDGTLAGFFSGGVQVEGWTNLTGTALVNREFTYDARLSVVSAASVDPAGGAYVQLSYWFLNLGDTAIGSLSLHPFVEPNANSANEETTSFDEASGVIVSTNANGAQAQLGFASCDGSYGHSIGDGNAVFASIETDAPNDAASFTGNGWFAQFVGLGGLAPGAVAQARFVFRAADAAGSVTDALAHCQATGDPPVEFLLPPPPPANDDRANAFPIDTIPYVNAQDTFGATDEVGEPAPQCAPGSRSVWYVLQAAETQRLAIDTLDSGFDTVLAVFDADLNQLACNDDTGGLQSAVTLRVTAGFAYFVQVTGFFGDTGPLVLRVSTPPPNDERWDAIDIGALPYTATQSTAGASSGVGDGAACAPIGATVWYRYVHQGLPALVTVDTFGSDFDTVVAVELSLGPQSPEVACNDDTDGLQSQASFLALPDRTYYIQVGGFFGDVGNLVLHVA